MRLRLEFGTIVLVDIAVGQGCRVLLVALGILFSYFDVAIDLGRPNSPLSADSGYSNLSARTSGSSAATQQEPRDFLELWIRLRVQQSIEGAAT